MGCLAWEFAGSWVELGLRVGMGGFWVGFRLLMFPSVSSSVVVQSSGVEPPASRFWSPSYGNIKSFPFIQHRRQNP